MWQYAFARCGIETIVLPDRYTQIIPYTFLDCTALRQVVCGSGMQKIYPHAFRGCRSLTLLQCSPTVDIASDYKD